MRYILCVPVFAWKLGLISSPIQVLTDSIMFEHFDSPYEKDRTNHGGGVLVICLMTCFTSENLNWKFSATNDHESIWVETVNPNI